MPSAADFFDEIDSARVARARELSELKRSFDALSGNDVLGVASKAVVVLSYATWEGFYNECVRAYFKFLVQTGRKVRDGDWMLLVCAFHPDFESMRDRNHSLESRRIFISSMQAKLECGFEAVDSKIIEARSNLNFARLAENYALLNFDLTKLLRVRNRLDKELVGWRHAVAHGASPDLSALDVADHVKFVGELLLLVSDCFQEAILERV